MMSCSFWAVAPAHQRQAYAAEAASALIDYAFTHLNLKRLVATTTYENLVSIGVMRNMPIPSCCVTSTQRESQAYLCTTYRCPAAIAKGIASWVMGRGARSP
jgi:hypothetical protein